MSPVGLSQPLKIWGAGVALVGVLRYLRGMDTQPRKMPSQADLRKAAEAIRELRSLKQEFLQCHKLITDGTARLVELLCETEARGVLLEESLTLVDTAFWLDVIDWQTKFVRAVLGFSKDPNRQTLRGLIEIFGPDRNRAKAEAEILEQQLKQRLATFAKPTDDDVRKVILKDQRRVLAIYLHVRSGYRGIDLARFYKVPKTTAYGWLEWFKALPEGLRDGILTFLDAQVPSLLLRQSPNSVPPPEKSHRQKRKQTTNEQGPDNAKKTGPPDHKREAG